MSLSQMFRWILMWFSYVPSFEKHRWTMYQLLWPKRIWNNCKIRKSNLRIWDFFANTFFQILLTSKKLLKHSKSYIKLTWKSRSINRIFHKKSQLVLGDWNVYPAKSPTNVSPRWSLAHHHQLKMNFGWLLWETQEGETPAWICTLPAVSQQKKPLKIGRNSK